MTNAISNIYLTHPFKIFTKSEVFLGCKIRQKKFVNTITSFFLQVHVFIHYAPLEKKYKNRNYLKRRTYGQVATLKCATVARGTLRCPLDHFV